MKTKSVIFFTAILFSIQTQIGVLFTSKKCTLKENISVKWNAVSEIDSFQKEADLVVRVGDIDNFGFDWPENFDPLSGESTPAHQFPYYPENDDPDGTDRIMVPSSFVYGNSFLGIDGYTSSTSRPENNPRPIVLNYDLKNIELNAATIQVFMDDFQPKELSSRFIVKLNGVRLDNFEKVINNFNQIGPIGKLVSVSLLPEYLHLLKDGKVELFFDDPYTGVGDGFAIDFVRLLINPKETENFGAITGVVTDELTTKPISDAVVDANGLVTINTDINGRFSLTNVRAGLTTVSASKTEYEPSSETIDIQNGKTESIEFKLKRKEENVSVIENQLKQKGKVALYGIYFDVAIATIRHNSEKALTELFKALKAGSYEKIIVSGHTDSDGDEAYNLELSKKRADAVKKWLVAKGLNSKMIVSVGYGESRPITANISNEGKSQNRRVEIEIGGL